MTRRVATVSSQALLLVGRVRRMSGEQGGKKASSKVEPIGGSTSIYVLSAQRNKGVGDAGVRCFVPVVEG